MHPTGEEEEQCRQADHEDSSETVLKEDGGAGDDDDKVRKAEDETDETKEKDFVFAFARLKASSILLETLLEDEKVAEGGGIGSGMEGSVVGVVGGEGRVGAVVLGAAAGLILGRHL